MSNKDQEKYKSELKYRMVQVRRMALRMVIRKLAKWEAMAAPADGYTVIIGCNTPLAKMLGANLYFLSQQDLSHCDRILVVLDRPREQMPFDVEPKLRARFPKLPVEFVYYSQQQAEVVAKVKWPWVNSWLSWSIGLGVTRTRYAMLQDFDAMLLRPDIVEERYRAIKERGHQFVGVRFYGGNGVIPDDGLASTFELILDAQYLRQNFKAIDAFNHVTRYNGRRVDFDTLLWCQTRGSQNSILPIDEEDMVHPSQVICQFEEHRNGRADRIPASNNLAFVPYFLFLAEEPEVLLDLTAQMERAETKTLQFFGRELDLSGMVDTHIQWITKQAYRLEKAVAGQPREEARRYFAALDGFVARLNGRQPALSR